MSKFDNTSSISALRLGLTQKQLHRLGEMV
jgi:hypothetical protein